MFLNDIFMNTNNKYNSIKDDIINTLLYFTPKRTEKYIMFENFLKVHENQIYEDELRFLSLIETIRLRLSWIEIKL